MDSEDKIHDCLEVISKCDHDVVLKNEQELKPIYLPMSLLKAITKNFSDGLRIGSGGFAVVYKGLLKRGGTVAVKKLLNTICMDDNQFQKEVSCLMKVRHKNIVRFLGYCADTQGKMEDYNGKFVLADERERLLCFEYLPNGSLENYIKDASGGLEWNKRYKIINGICEGIQYLHENNIVHLDLKPANILLNDNMVPKISDFGQSRCFKEMQSRTVTSTLIGSIGYLAPEFFSGEITRKLDIYSLGAIIGEMLTGQKGHSPVENVLECWRKRFGESYPDTDNLLEQVRVCINIRISCGELDPTKRPDIQQITAILNEQSNSDEFPKNNRKRKQPTSSGPANSTGTGNTVGPANSPPSTPSTHTPGDGLGMGGNMCHVPKNLMIYGADGTGLAASSIQMDDLEQFGDVGSLEDNVESFLSNDDGDLRDIFAALKRSPAEPNPGASKGFTFSEVKCWQHIRDRNIVCCHFSSDGKILASAGIEKRALLWNMENFHTQYTPEEHGLIITDVRFRPNSSQLATSSFDRTIKLWNAADPGFSLHTFSGHSGQVTSLDFHPKKTDLLCSCDGTGEIRYWNVTQFTCLRAIKGGSAQVRFQPHVGQFLAAAAENVVSIFDIEMHGKKYTLQGHNTDVQSVCWDNNGEYIASVSQDLVKVWSISSGKCIHELSSNGNKFHSCVFHPSYSNLLVIGGYQSLEVWNMVKNQSLTVQAHEGIIGALAQSPVTGLIASGHDNSVKVWK